MNFSLALLLNIVGQWHFTGMIYQGQALPPRDPHLVLQYEFSVDGQDRLYWTYNAGEKFCERRGQYTYTNGVIHDHITWVNPQNAADCAADPDMQLDHETWTPAEVTDTTLHLHLPWGENELTYVFSREPI
ncbi:MAG: hypothetical protein JST16_12540 [Bdellovibrionales bacterium]|nr:hypothetical protein [Bdellovibrionales bacterium]